MSLKHPRGAQAGFSLLEALVAAALAALLVSALLMLLASSGRLSGSAETRHRAIMLADRLLAEPAVPGEGVDGRLRWTRAVTPVAPGFDGYVLAEIRVEVRPPLRSTPVQASTRRIIPQ